jgi:hypothetical protein
MSNDNNIMNIQLNKVTGKCDEKCMFKYNYNTSPTCIATNQTDFFSLSYDKYSKPPVTFNNSEYNVVSISLYFPSVHYFNHSYSDGEIVILHKCDSNGKFLKVCLPLSNNSGSPSNLLNNILNRISTLHISSGYSSDLKLDVEYNLNNIVKYEPFYYYYDKNNNDIICYGLSNAIYVSSDLTDTIKNLITKPSETSLFTKVSNLFYNKQGPVKYDGDEIYIDCKPVNNSGTEEILFDNKGEIVNGNDPSVSTSVKTPKNLTLLEILGIFLFVVVLCVAGTSIYRKVTNKSSAAAATAAASAAAAASPIASPLSPVNEEYQHKILNIIQLIKDHWQASQSR